MIGQPLIRLDSVASTQDIAFDLAQLGAPEGTTVLAQHQFAGRGRAGRRWETVPGEALLFSIVLRPSITGDRLTPLSILIADAIAESLMSLYGLSASIKWPNDVLLDARKVSGVLIQVRGGVAVAGIGINLFPPPDGLEDVATGIREHIGHDPMPDVLLSAVCSGFEQRYRAVGSGQAATFFRAINERLFLRGQEVLMRDAHKGFHGVLRGVREDGALLLDTQGGQRAMIAGELVRGPRVTLP